MKTLTNQFKKAIVMVAFFSLSILAFSNLSAQNYFTPGQQYVFRSIIPGGQTRVITIVFDANGNATLSSSLVAIDPSDKWASWSFTPSDETNFDATTNTFNITQNLDKYILISFTDPTHTQATPLGGITISCTCTKQLPNSNPPPAPDCTPSAQSTGPNCFCYTCTVNATCAACKQSNGSSSGPINPNKPYDKYLIIKANSLNYQ